VHPVVEEGALAPVSNHHLLEQRPSRGEGATAQDVTQNAEDEREVVAQGRQLLAS
jgi:hypothetical protein